MQSEPQAPAHPTHDAHMPSPVRVARRLGREDNMRQVEHSSDRHVPAARSGWHLPLTVSHAQKTPAIMTRGQRLSVRGMLTAFSPHSKISGSELVGGAGYWVRLLKYLDQFLTTCKSLCSAFRDLSSIIRNRSPFAVTS